MVSAQFRAGETSAKPSWIGRATGPLRRGQVRVTVSRPRPPASSGHDPAGHVIQGRSIIGPAGVLPYPSMSLLRATRLHNLLYRRQPQQIWQTGKVAAYGTVRLVHRRRHISVYFHPLHYWRKNWTFTHIGAATARPVIAPAASISLPRSRRHALAGP